MCARPEYMRTQRDQARPGPTFMPTTQPHDQQPTTCLPQADMSTTLPPQGELGFRVA